jgi:hypothetical protein
MDARRKLSARREQGAALILVLAFVVLVTGLVVAYFVRATSDRPVAHASFNQTKADQLVASATDNIIGDLRQEIVNGSTATTVGGFTTYTPTAAGNMIPQRSGNAAGVSNLIRRSVRSDPIPAPGLVSRASEVNSTTDISANGRSITSSRWNSHYLVPKKNTSTDDSVPIDAFTAATPDWVYLTNNGAAVITAPSASALGRYAYAIYDEGGLLDMNVAGYPTGTIAIQSGRKGSVAFADLTVLGQYGLPNPSSGGTPVYQIDRLVGWRNYATTQPTNSFPDSVPVGQAFARNFQTSSTAATNYFNVVVNNPNGFLKARGDPLPSPTAWPNPSPAPYPWNDQTDQIFLTRQQLLAFRTTTQFSPNALQYLGTFSRESNSPSFSPSTPPGSTIDYAALSSTSNAVNPNFLLRRVGTGFTRFDGTAATTGEPLVKTRFALSRLAWITYKGPSAVVYAANNSDPAITQLTAAGVPLSTIQAGTAANIKACFGLVWDSRAYVPATGTTPSKGQQWVYISPSSANTGGNFDPVTNATGNPASAIKRLDTVASEDREPDFFELLQATILSGSLGENTGGGVTAGAGDVQAAKTFPDLHMSNTTLHALSIGAAIIDQADPDSIPTRVQCKPATATVWWTAYGVESLPYITQIYPITGTSPVVATPRQWATYLLFQLWNPHIGAALSPAAPQVRLRVDGGIAIFTGGNGQTYSTATDKQILLIPATGQSMALVSGALPPTSTPAPLTTSISASAPAVGSATAPCGFEVLPPKLTGSGTSITNYVGLRLLPDKTLVGAVSGQAPPQLEMYLGTDPTHQFNVTMEYDAGGGAWVPYNHFIGIIDRNSVINGVTGSWINGATVPVHNSGNLAGTPSTSTSTNSDQFSAARLTDSPLPDCLMKSDPRATRFGIFQMKTNPTTNGRITESLWPSGSLTAPNGYGGAIADPAGPVEHAPIRFSGQPYFPATFCINDGQPSSIRNTVTTNYADNDGIIRPADSTYPDPSIVTKGSSTPYYATSTDYHPIILNRPFRNVAELGYVFRDLPWKSIDLFTDHSADAGLLDVFTINDGIGLWAANGSFLAMGAVPTMIAGQVNLNASQAAVLQPILAGAIWDELDFTNTVSKTGTTATAAPVMASNIVTATDPTSSTPLLNRSELLTRANLPLAILPLPTGGTHNQSVKARREVVGRAISSVSQTRTWNLMIDVVAQSGRYPPTATTAADLKTKFIVEGEQRYWVHVAIDRFTGEVIDRQVEVVKE